MRLESLENRLLMAVDPVISEFLAINDSNLEDKDGDFSDWIEIHNPGAEPINLEGWRLTDDEQLIDTWTFPSVTIPAQGYLVVFASGKDVVVGPELHTDFSLSESGEYLGLVAPDGARVVSSYAPYPAQVTDISYGIGISEERTPLVGPQARGNVHIPTSGALGTDWHNVGFDDGDWTSGPMPIGFDTETAPETIPGWTVRMIDVAQTFSNMAQTSSLLDGNLGGYTISFNGARDYPVVNFGDTQNFPGSPADPVLPSGSQTSDRYAMRASADVFIPQGTWTFNAASDDGVSLRIPGATFTNRFNEAYAGTPFRDDTIVFDSPRGHNHTSGTITVPTGGLRTTIIVDFYENDGGDSLEVSVAPGSTRWGLSSFQLLSNGVYPGWTVTTTSSSPPPDYNPIIGTNVQADMLNRAGGAYVRATLNEVLDPADFELLRLRVRYDDAFVAYLNGVEIARRNFTGTPLWNAVADGGRTKTQGTAYEVINVPVPPGVLQAGVGTNVLAIHGMNESSSDGTFLIDAELIGVDQLGSAPRYFLEPTPGGDNSASDLAGQVSDTNFSVDRGFFNSPFGVAITTTTDGASIRYTLDGTQPTATNGILYTGPIQINKTTTLRAVAYKAGMLESNVDTQTYIFVSDVLQQSPNGQAPPGWPTSWGSNVVDYGMDPDIVNSPTWGPLVDDALLSIPTMSVVMNLDDLFGPSGIYANPRSDGRQFERPASLELINPDGTTGFQANAGIRIRGGFSRDPGNPKHAFRFFFRSEYGDPTLEYPLFGPDGASSFDGFDLRTFQNYSWSYQGDGRGIFLRDQLMRDAQLAMGQPAKRGDYYHLYINGQYWGLYNTDERSEADYSAEYFGGEPDDYDVIKPAPDNGYNVYATDGNINAWSDYWNQLLSLEDRANQGQDTHAQFMRLLGKNADGTDNPNFPVYLDPDNLIDYMMVIYYGGNKDAPLSNFLGNQSPNNFFATRDRTGRDGWKFYVHDAEHSMVEPGSGNVEDYLSIDRTGNEFGPWPLVRELGKSNPQFMFQILVKNPEFKLRVADRIHKWFHNDGVLTPAKMTAMFDARGNEMFQAVVAESARWGDSKRGGGSPLTRDNWQSEMNKIRGGYLPFRTDRVFQQFVDRGWYADVQPPNLSQHGGQLPDNFTLSISNPNGAGTIYYTTDGSDPRRIGGGVSPSATAYTGGFALTGPGTVKARVLRDGEWSPVTEAVFTTDTSALRVSEINYNPAPPAAGSPYTAQDFEFIELLNTGNRTLNLRDVEVQGIGFTFGNTILQAGQRIVLVKNQAAFESRYPGVPVGGVFSGSLDNAGEPLTIRGPAGVVLDFDYEDNWYPVTDGGGYSLVAVNPAAPAALYGKKENWRPSNIPDGGPGAADPGTNGEAIVINEVLANATGGDGDWIELHNTTNAAIDIGGWYLSNDPLDLDKYTVPAGTSVPANGYLVLTQAQHFGGAFTISELGGDVLLTSNAGTALGGYREGVDFGASAPDVPFGRVTKSTGGTDFVPMSAPTRGAANAQPLVGPVVMTEIMYHPAIGGAEFIELQNLTGTDLNVAGWKFIEGIDYTFAAGSTIPAFGYALVVGIDPATFRTTYNVPAGVPVFGPFTTGTLDNNGGNLRLAKPGVPVGAETPYVQVDQVKYDNSAPWPAAAGGSGPSISRIVPSGYGNDAGNWIAGPPGGTPGRSFAAPGRPTALTATAMGPSVVRLSWTDNSSEDGFRIERSTDNVSFSLAGTVAGNVTTFDDSGLSPNTFYYYRVRSFNNAGESSNSNRASARTSGSQTVNLVGMNSTWSYNQSRQDLGTAWIAPGYVEQGVVGWTVGTGLFHNESAGVTLPAARGTQLNLGPTGDRTPTFYFRIKFTLNVPPSQVTALKLTTVLDDGAAFWINGNPTPIHTSGVDPAALGYGDWATRSVGDATSFEPTVELNLSQANLVQGDNWLAVAVKQINDTSSDVVFGASLVAELSAAQASVTADVVDVTPDPRNGPVNSVTIAFSEPVSGFDLSDLSLTRGTGAATNLLTAGVQTLSSSDGGRTWVLGNLGGLTALSSEYTLHLLAGGSGITGGGKMLNADASDTFRVTGNVIQGTAGNDNYYVRVNGSNLEVFNGTGPSGTPMFSAPLMDVPGLSISGAEGNDTVEVAGDLPFVPVFSGGAGTDRLVISAGTRKFTTDSAAADGVEEIVAGGSGRVEFAAAQNLASLTVRDSGRVDVTAAGVTANALSIAGEGVLDLHEQDLVVHATAATRDAVLAAVSGFIRNARNGTLPRWTNPGLTSSAAAADALTGLAVGLSGDDVVVKYSYNGDGNRDGRINADDYFRIDQGFLAQPQNPRYDQGDFNFDGRVNADDYFLIDQAFLGQGTPLGGAAVAPVATAVSASASSSSLSSSVQQVVVEEEQKKTVRPARGEVVESATRRVSKQRGARRR